MFKLAAILVTMCLVYVAQADLVTTHHVLHEPSLVKVGQVVHSVPSAVSHQSITQVHGKAHVVEPLLAPVVKTSIHAAAPVVVKNIQPIVPVINTIHTPIAQTYHTAPVIHSVPLLHSASVVSVQQN